MPYFPPHTTCCFPRPCMSRFILMRPRAWCTNISTTSRSPQPRFAWLSLVGLDNYLAQIGSLDKGNSVKVGEVSDDYRLSHARIMRVPSHHCGRACNEGEETHATTMISPKEWHRYTTGISRPQL
ncbi:hypothetical protein SCLCIDRAFT_802206 [Scleroderma citrinum Foug A]|uniref:Uncharacterized protein n=1 Tax=Scleroderma citrinum Foug A TaxID=1036808 RepID=A0A0C2ZLK7_9AGAM|nr:hypothetical protein SCLCIDRAFT_802206 [Scleroderma citrinum Foug A]